MSSVEAADGLCTARDCRVRIADWFTDVLHGLSSDAHPMSHSRGRVVRSTPTALLVAVFAGATFLNAALLFAVEPMFTKMVLPLLGGTPSVWNTCLLFFQAGLMAGYLYAHLTSRWLSVTGQAALHLVLLAVSLMALPVTLASGLAPPTTGTGAAIGWLLALLATVLGAPFVLLSAGTPMLQRWFASTQHPEAQDPYVLYVASNAGSFAALLAYPTLIEPRWRLSEQSAGWSIGYALLIALLLGAWGAAWRWRALREDGGGNEMVKEGERVVANVDIGGGPPRPTRPPRSSTSNESHDSHDSHELHVAPSADPGDTSPTHRPFPTLVPTTAWRLRWLLLSFAPSSLLLGVTTFLSTDIAAVPFLWVVPLALYLLTFVIVFARHPLLNRRIMLALQVVLSLGLMILMATSPARRLTAVAALHLLAFFVTALVCHRQLADARPHSKHLTEFYLWMSLGGVLGGVFNVLIAPLLYSRVLEYPIALIIALALRPMWPASSPPRRALLFDLGLPLLLFGLVTLGYRLPTPVPQWSDYAPVAYLGGVAVIALSFYKRPIRLALGAAAIFVGADLGRIASDHAVYEARSFFGVYRVRLWENYMLLQHGTTTHGGQSLVASRQTEPLTYYHREGPLGDLFRHVTDSVGARRVALVGLGTGTTACYARPGERWSYFEIDPLVVAIARSPQLFSYLSRCQPSGQIVMGDARLSIAAVPDSSFDFIMLDAFSSDAIPVHLMTREALQVYSRKLRLGGVVAFHISNRYLDLRPVLVELARDAKLAGAMVDRDVTPAQQDKLYYGSRWIALARGARTLAPLIRDAGWQVLPPAAKSRLWTDDFSDVFGALKR